MNEQAIIENTKTYVYALFKDECPSHDFEHILRVYHNALKLQEAEGGDYFIIAMAALLHDVEDHKLSKKPPIREWLEKNNLSETQIQAICKVVNSVSYSKNLNTVLESIEQKIVQDADRLDAIGAIGIARALSYGGEQNRPIYCPLQMQGATSSLVNSIEHFYEKLLLIKDKLNTNTAKKIARKRHALLKDYLTHLQDEIKFSSTFEQQTKAHSEPI